MSSKNAPWATAITSGLVIAILAMATVMVKHEFFGGGSSASTPPRPTYTAAWRSLLSSGSSGGGAAPIQLIEFLDLQCPVCRRAQPAVRAAEAKYGARLQVTWVPFPLAMHPFAAPAAVAAECARRQGAFDSFVDAVFARQDSLGLRAWQAYASDGGIRDISAFSTCLTDHGARSIVDSGRSVGTRFGIVGTPTILINGWRYDGALSVDELDDAIARLLRHELPAGASALLAAPGTDVAIRDKTGVPTLVYEQQALSRVPQLWTSPVPIGTTEIESRVEFDLTSVTGALMLRDGRMVTLAPLGSRLLVFGPDGAGERVIGRAGSGPGEFRRLENLAPGLADSIITLDGANRRLYWTTASNGIVRTLALARDGQSRRPLEMVAGELPDGRVVLFGTQRWPTNVPPDSTMVDSIPVAALDAGGELSPIATVGGAAFITVPTRYRGRPDNETDLVRLSPHAAVVVWDSLIATASTRRYRIELRTATGRLVGAVEVQRPRRPVTAEMRQIVIDHEIELLTASGREHPIDPQESSRLIREARFADSLPAIQDLYVSVDHTLWVVDAIAPGDSTWSATGFALDGHIVGRLHGADHATPLAFGGQRVAALVTDSDGVASLRSYRIITH